MPTPNVDPQPRYTPENFAALIDVTRMGPVASFHLGRLLDDSAPPQGMTRWEIAATMIKYVAHVDTLSDAQRTALAEPRDTFVSEMATAGGLRYWVVAAVLRELFCDCGEVLVVGRRSSAFTAQR